jgi:hypothetical protein
MRRLHEEVVCLSAHPRLTRSEHRKMNVVIAGKIRNMSELYALGVEAVLRSGDHSRNVVVARPRAIDDDPTERWVHVISS